MKQTFKSNKIGSHNLSDYQINLCEKSDSSCKSNKIYFLRIARCFVAGSIETVFYRGRHRGWEAKLRLYLPSSPSGCLQEEGTGRED